MKLTDVLVMFAGDNTYFAYCLRLLLPTNAAILFAAIETNMVLGLLTIIAKVNFR